MTKLLAAAFLAAFATVSFANEAEKKKEEVTTEQTQEQAAPEAQKEEASK